MVMRERQLHAATLTGVLHRVVTQIQNHLSESHGISPDLNRRLYSRFHDDLRGFRECCHDLQGFGASLTEIHKSAAGAGEIRISERKGLQVCEDRGHFGHPRR